MNYKNIIKKRKTRLKLLKLLSWLPDKTMIKLQYRIKLGKKLNLNKPKRYTEKLQWYKINYRNPLMAKCADKAEVREYIESKGLKGILTKSYGTYDNFDEINFDKLPEQFVIKDTLGGGGNSVIIVKNKNNENIKELREKIDEWLKTADKKNAGREWVYENKKHRILIEEYIKPKCPKNGLTDYKFFCFNGKIKYIYVIADRILGQKAKLAIYDENFEKLECYRKDEEKLTRKIQKPTKFEEMKKIARELSADFPHVRVDLFNENGKILFGELTFFDGSGYMQYEPDTFDYEMGSHFRIEDFYEK